MKLVQSCTYEMSTNNASKGCSEHVVVLLSRSGTERQDLVQEFETLRYARMSSVTLKLVFHFDVQFYNVVWNLIVVCVSVWFLFLTQADPADQTRRGDDVCGNQTWNLKSEGSFQLWINDN